MDDADPTVPTGLSPPSLAHVLPLGNEAKWSDLLAALIETDPDPLYAALSVRAPAGVVSVHREVSVGKANRPDIVVNVDGQPWAVIEVKVLSGQGRKQLARYMEAVPNATHYAVLYPQRLGIDVGTGSPWQRLPWETLLDAYTTSTHPWVAATSTAWQAHLLCHMPTIDGDTVWGDLQNGEDFVNALRARIAWIHSRLDLPQPIEHELRESSAGASWLDHLYLPAGRDGYRVIADVEERLGVRDFPKYAGNKPVIGPSVFVGLQQIGVTTSAGYDWDYLHALWPFMSTARTDWVANAAAPRGHDRDGHRSIVAKGAPRYLGIGFGEGQTKYTNTCAFGARFQLAPQTTLQVIVDRMNSVVPLLEAMAQVP